MSARPKHSAEVLAAFQQGETRLVYARYKQDLDAPPFHLVDGTAHEVKAWAKEHLCCLVPDCPDPWLTTVARTGKRDGFTHRPGAGKHGLEGLAHLQSKELIARWVREHYPEVEVVPEQATASGERRADVMLTWPDGRQVAVEIQYAGLTPDAWRERHESYRRQGITDVWLLGHLGKHLRAARKASWEPAGAADGQITLGPLHHAILQAGLPLMWINPDREQVGLSWMHERPDRHFATDRDGHDGSAWAVHPSEKEHGDGRAHFGVHPLVEAILTAEGLSLPGHQLLTHNGQRLARINADRRRRWEAAVAADAERRAKKAADDAQRAASAEVAREELRLRRTADAERHHAQLPNWERRWLESDLRRKVVARYGGIPDVIASKVGPIEGVLAYPEHWHAVVYGQLVLGKEPGTRWTVGDVYEVLQASGINLHRTDRALVALTLVTYVRHLAAAGLVRLEQKRYDRHIYYAEVMGSIEVIERWRAEQADERRRQVAQQRQAKAEAEERWQEQLEVIRQGLATRRAASTETRPERAPVPPAPSPRTNLRCRRCRLALDERLAEEGVHIGC